MTKKEITLQQIQKLGLLAVIRGPSADLTLKMVEALIKGGVNGIEITFTTPNALEVVNDLGQEFSSDIILGMGTLTSADQAKQAKDAGAAFLVSPHTEANLAAAMTDTGRR